MNQASFPLPDDHQAYHRSIGNQFSDHYLEYLPPSANPRKSALRDSEANRLIVSLATLFGTRAFVRTSKDGPHVSRYLGSWERVPRTIPIWRHGIVTQDSCVTDIKPRTGVQWRLHSTRRLVPPPALRREHWRDIHTVQYYDTEPLLFSRTFNTQVTIISLQIVSRR